VVKLIDKFIKLAQKEQILVYLKHKFSGHKQRLIPLVRDPKSATVGLSAHRINSLINEFLENPVSYLEIGLSLGKTFQSINMPTRVGVDPQPGFNTNILPSGVTIHKMSSNEFFARNEISFDFIFIDGSHKFEDVLQDIFSAAKCLREQGLILIDDTVPNDEFSALPEMGACFRERREKTGSLNPSWTGDGFKAICLLKTVYPEIKLMTLMPAFQTLVFWDDQLSGLEKRIDASLVQKFSELDFKEVFSNKGYFLKIFEPTWEWQLGITQR